MAAMPNFTLPGDTSASDRYYHRDITEPFVLSEGRLKVPTGPGLGVNVDLDYLAEITSSTEMVQRERRAVRAT
jgi:o-succinylbenzoate synthase